MRKQTVKKGFEWYRILTKEQRKRFRRDSHFCSSRFKGTQRLNYNLNKNTTARNFIFGAFDFEMVKDYKYWIQLSVRLQEK